MKEAIDWLNYGVDTPERVERVCELIREAMKKLSPAVDERYRWTPERRAWGKTILEGSDPGTIWSQKIQEEEDKQKGNASDEGEE